MNNQPRLKQHAIIISERKRADIDGVTELLSYDENAVTMVTSCGSLAVEGKDLHVDKLSLETGELSVCGELSGVYYYDRPDKQKSGFWSKIIG
jgi:sporulation protein YabP